MSETAVASHHSHEPVPSKWPIITALGAGLLPVGIVMNGHGQKAGIAVLLLGLLITILGAGRWWGELLRDKFAGKDLADADGRLKTSFKLFIASEAAIFAAFFAALFYARYHATAWPPTGTPHLDITLPIVNTFILLFSSVTCHFAHMALERGKQEQFVSGLLMTMFLGAIFLCGQAYEYGVLNGESLNIKSGIFGTTFFMLTGFHGLHVLMGVVFLNVVYGAAMRGRITREQHFPFLAAGWYWHFVDAIWIGVFSVVYLWK
ncbi:MAG TPA: heme-copper oxidase subunit III [Candidatus Eisenbacteria bacterium]|jgi:cytochrome c oxidase subunit 3|nr:heme-copper oxidase subunit III [Candidatus Eisenbacteria bacterium]